MQQFILENFFLVLVLIIIWTLPWKAVALWKAARLKDTWWFVALFLLNTLALLEIAYIFVFSKRQKSPAAKRQPVARKKRPR